MQTRLCTSCLRKSNNGNPSKVLNMLRRRYRCPLSRVYPCKHEFGSDCIVSWFKAQYNEHHNLAQLTCPCCRETSFTLSGIRISKTAVTRPSMSLFIIVEPKKPHATSNTPDKTSNGLLIMPASVRVTIPGSDKNHILQSIARHGSSACHSLQSYNERKN